MSVWVLGITAATTAITAAVQIDAQQDAAKANTMAQIQNNQLAEQEAMNRELEAAEQIKRERVKKRKEMARLRNKLAGSGTLTTSGTPLAILGESSANMETGIDDALRRANMEASSMRAQGKMGLWEAGQYQKAANNQSIGTALSAAGSIAEADA